MRIKEIILVIIDAAEKEDIDIMWTSRKHQIAAASSKNVTLICHALHKY